MKKGTKKVIQKEKRRGGLSPITPLADRMRPRTLVEFVGQSSLVGEGTFLEKAIISDTVPSLILWGPPGSGKTTLAYIIAHETGALFLTMSAVRSGIAELREVIEAAEHARIEGKRTILFLDEIHRWNKSQQDALLPHVEHGTITLIGATTENPSFEVNAALLSRARVFVLEKLSDEAVKTIVMHALADTERGLGGHDIALSDEALGYIVRFSGGDARIALGTLEIAAGETDQISGETIKEIMQRPHLLYDKTGEEHYNIISALHKSMRGNDADAALYWLGRMLESGEDPLYVARRLVRFASEDVGLANSLALPQAVAAYQACMYIGMPECELALAQAVAYLAKCKKSVALYSGYGKVKQDIRELPNDPVPVHLRNAPTKLMKELGYGKDYKYTPHFDNPDDAAQDFLPERLRGRKYLP
ncbi:MAG: replication-associated recombination protein A [Candidatus Yonathbacteria bacterium]|nr:replication-associated recombination protein A [Candidatus Yonathbacteria bacterium]